MPGLSTTPTFMSHTDRVYLLLAHVTLAVHVGIILFNVFGLIVIPLGAWRGWRCVRRFWWRALHLILLATVAGQAYFGRACFLTLWQGQLEELAGGSASSGPLLQGMVALLFWPLPLWIFALLYVVALGGCLFLWWLVPPERPGQQRPLRADPDRSPGGRPVP